MKMSRLPSVVISACQGHQGKTTVSTGLCAAWAEQGLVVQPFKKGMDYIDPSWLSSAAGRTCRNLDAFLMPKETLLQSFERACQGADISLMEGVMGLYDSYDDGGEGSTAWMARLIGAPVVLLVNAGRMTRSVAAMIRGFQSFEPETGIASVILNHVSLDGHKRKLIAAVEKYCDIPVVGAIPNDDRLSLDEQHLGLRPYRSAGEAGLAIRRIREAIKTHVDVAAVLAIARKSRTQVSPLPDLQGKEPVVRIGVFFDKAFNFYYPENLEALRLAGADLVFIDSLSAQELPDIDGLYIGGGFPELFSSELEANVELRHAVARAVEDNLPVYAECAGLMYLCRRIHGREAPHEMAGAIPSDVVMCSRTQGHGYVVGQVRRENPWFPAGSSIRGHQFHHSRLTNTSGLEFAFRMTRKREIDPEFDGIVHKNLFAAYTHMHVYSFPGWAGAFVALALLEKRRRSLFSGQEEGSAPGPEFRIEQNEFKG